MSTNEVLPTWAPRVKQSLVRRLYESDALGLYDEDLLNEVGWTLVERCKSFIAANAAVQGRAPCPVCSSEVPHHSQANEILQCPECGWTLPWKVYFQTIQHKQLSGAAPVMEFFQDFVDRFPKARDPRDKMLLIDGLIHGWHWYAEKQMETRAAGVNLIEGKYHQVVDFLDELSYGDRSTPGLHEKREEWRRRLNRTADLWNDERLRKPPRDS